MANELNDDFAAAQALQQELARRASTAADPDGTATFTSDMSSEQVRAKFMQLVLRARKGSIGDKM
jgi:hypothetical protein